MVGKACWSPRFLECRMGAGIHPHPLLWPELSELGGLKPLHAAAAVRAWPGPHAGGGFCWEALQTLVPRGSAGPGLTVQQGGEVTGLQQFQIDSEVRAFSPDILGPRAQAGSRGWGQRCPHCPSPLQGSSPGTQQSTSYHLVHVPRGQGRKAHFLGAPRLDARFVILCDPEAAGITGTPIQVSFPESLCLFGRGDRPFQNGMEAIGPSPLPIHGDMSSLGYSFKHLVRSPKTIYIQEVKSPVQGHVRGQEPRELPSDKARGSHRGNGPCGERGIIPSRERDSRSAH